MARRNVPSNDQLSLFDTDSLANIDKEKSNAADRIHPLDSAGRPLADAGLRRGDLRYETDSAVSSPDGSTSDTAAGLPVSRGAGRRTQRTIPTSNHEGTGGQSIAGGNRGRRSAEPSTPDFSVPPTPVRNPAPSPGPDQVSRTVGNASSTVDGASSFQPDIRSRERSDEINNSGSTPGTGASHRSGNNRRPLEESERTGRFASDAAQDSPLSAVDESVERVSGQRGSNAKPVEAGADARRQSDYPRGANRTDNREASGRGGEFLPGGRFTLAPSDEPATSPATITADQYRLLAAGLDERERFIDQPESLEGYALQTWRSQLEALATRSGLVSDANGEVADNPFWATVGRVFSEQSVDELTAMVNSPAATEEYVSRAHLELARRGRFYTDGRDPDDTDLLLADAAFGRVGLDELTDYNIRQITERFETADFTTHLTPPAREALSALGDWAHDATDLIVADQVAENPQFYREQLRLGRTTSPFVRDALLAHLDRDELIMAWAEGHIRSTTADDDPARLLLSELPADLDETQLQASHESLSTLRESAPVHVQPYLDELLTDAYAEIAVRADEDDTHTEATAEPDTTVEEPSSNRTADQPRAGTALTFSPPAESLAPHGAKARAHANIEAIKLLATLDEENRWPTAEEQTTLATYSGWGAADQVFQSNNDQWAREYDDLVAALPDNVSIDQLRASVTTAFYTAPGVTTAMWDVLKTAGFDRGHVLEPGSGIGGFIGAAPNAAEVTGIELDPIASRISSLLYPDATILNRDFTAVSPDTRPFDAAIGNVPFSNRDKPTDQRFNPDGLSVHNYFISKSAQLVHPGGYVALITSAHTSDAAQSAARKEIAKHADLVSAVRLPEETFRSVAGTSVISDVLVMRVREPDTDPSDLTQQWLSTNTTTIGDTQVRINDYFIAHPDHIIGETSIGYNQWGNTIMRANASEDEIAPALSTILRADIAHAVENQQGYTPLSSEASSQQSAALQSIVSDAAAPTPIPGRITYRIDETGAYEFSQYAHQSGTWEPMRVAKNLQSESAELIDLRDAETALRQAYQSDTGIELAQKRLHQLYDTYVDAHGPINRFVMQAGRVPSATAQKKAYTTLADDWRAANGFEPGDPLPEATETLLREQAAEPTPRKVQRHLAGLRGDASIQNVLALERFDEATGTAQKAPLFDRNPARPVTAPDHADSLADAVSITRAETGDFDLHRIAELTDSTVDEATAGLLADGLAFRNPQAPDELIERGDYLSGFVAEKLTIARLAANNDPQFRTNVAALQDVQPPEIDSFTIRPGATWVPEHYYEQFANEVFDTNHWAGLKVSRDNGSWTVSVDKNYWEYGGTADMEYGLVAANNRDGSNYNFQATGRARDATNQGVACSRNDGVAIPAYKTLEAVLNLSAPKASWSKIWVEEHGGKDSSHGQATAFLARRADLLKQTFSSWIMDDPERARNVTKAYNDTFNGFVPRTYDGSARAMPGLGDTFVPYGYQRNAVERIVNEPGVLLNHVVGAGKTGTMFMGAAELKRLGLARQPWMVVPNHLADQVTREAIQWYPTANVLSAAGVSNPTERARFIAQTGADDWDLVIVPQSVFERIPVDDETQVEYLQGQLAEVRHSLQQAKATAGSARTPSVKQVEGSVKAIENKLDKLLDSPTDQTLTLNQTPCDYLIVDEAHMYKNLMRSSQVSDLNHQGSKKASDLDMKLDWLRKSKAESGANAPVVTFATGTPIANNLAEIWVMAKYLRPDICQKLEIDDINAFGATFTDQVADVEVKPSGSGLRQKVRTASYANISELATASSLFMDVVTSDDITADLPELASGSTNRVIEFDVEQEVKDFIADLGVRSDYDWDADPDRRRTTSKIGADVTGQEIDMALKIASDGRKVTLDGRLVGLTIDGPGSRVEAVCSQILDQWDQTKDRIYLNADGTASDKPGGVQIVFCDSGTPGGANFSIYDAIRNELVARGMDRSRIAFVHEWDKDKATLFQKCNDGDFDVVIGSTPKMGTGANLQRRAVALHHVDIPWKPADLTQREGRIMRQGNQNEKIEIFNYVAAGTFDAVMWQTLYRKQRFIDQFTAADRGLRQMDALDDSAAQAAAHNKAIATGDPRYVDLLNYDREVERLESLKQEWESSQASHRHAVDAANFTIRRTSQQLDQLAPHLEAADKWSQLDDSDAKTWALPTGEVMHDRAEAARALSDGLARIAHTRSTNRQPLLTIGDVPLTARYDYGEVEIGLAGAEESVRFRVSIDEIADAVSHTTDDRVSSRAYGILTRAENRVGDIQRVTHQLTNDLDFAESELSRLKEAPAATAFAHDAALADAVTRRDDLREELNKENASEQAKRQRAERAERLRVRGREPMWTLELSPTEGYAKAVCATDDRHAVVRAAKTREAEALRANDLISDTEYEHRIRQANPEALDFADDDLDYSILDDDTLTSLAAEYPRGISPRMREEVASRGIAISSPVEGTTAAGHDRHRFLESARAAIAEVLREHHTPRVIDHSEPPTIVEQSVEENEAEF